MILLKKITIEKLHLKTPNELYRRSNYVLLQAGARRCPGAAFFWGAALLVKKGIGNGPPGCGCAARPGAALPHVGTLIVGQCC